MHIASKQELIMQDHKQNFTVFPLQNGHFVLRK